MPINRQKLLKAMREFTENLEQQDAPNTTPDWINPVWILGQNSTPGGVGSSLQFWAQSESFIVNNTQNKNGAWNVRDVGDTEATIGTQNVFGYLPPPMIPTDVFLRSISIVSGKIAQANYPPQPIWGWYRLNQLFGTQAGRSISDTFLVPGQKGGGALMQSVNNLANVDYSSQILFDPGVQIFSGARPYFTYELRTTQVHAQSDVPRINPVPGGNNWGSSQASVYFIAHLEHYEQSAEWGFRDTASEPPTPPQKTTEK